jgi:adenylate cyclase
MTIVSATVPPARKLLGEIDRAIDLLETWLPLAVPTSKLWFKNDSDLEPIRTHPRYKKLLELAS